MESKVIAIALVLIPLIFGGVSLDLHLYLFNRPKYLLAKMAEKCVAADMEKADYIECKKLNPKDTYCDLLNASAIEKSGQCVAATAAVRAETNRQIANSKVESLSDK